MQSSLRSTTGSVTAEFAVILPVVVLVIAMLINVMIVGMHQSNLHQAAAVAARQLARGEAVGTIQTTVHQMASGPTNLTTAVSDQWASVELSSRIPGPLGLVPGFELNAQAKAPNQWTVRP